MSMCHWVVEGIGIPASKLFDHLDRNKCLDFLKSELEYEMTEAEEATFDVETEFEDYIWDADLQNLAEAFCLCDDSKLLYFGENGDGESYVYYAPSYPWRRHANEPNSLKDVHEIIKNAVVKLCNLSFEEIELLIDDALYEYGCG